MTEELAEYALSRLQVVKPGDRVHVGPSRPRKRDGFDATVHRLLQDDRRTYIEVYGPYGWRILPVTRVQRKVRQ
jgi:hypothetical protein